MSLMDLAYRMGRLEAELNDFSDFKHSSRYTRDRVNDLMDNVIQIFNDLKQVYISLQTMKSDTHALHSRLLEVEKHVFNSK